MNDRERLRGQMDETRDVLRKAIENLDVPLVQKDNLAELIGELRELAYQAGKAESAGGSASILFESKFSLGGIITELPGFTKGETWDGWECPYFTQSEALRLVGAWNTPNEEQEIIGKGPARYDAASDCFVFEIEGEADSFGPEIFGGVKLYPIGAHGWCWEISRPSTMYCC